MITIFSWAGSWAWLLVKWIAPGLSPRLSKALASLAVGGACVLLLALGYLGWRAHIRSERDAWWAAQIREKSGRVTEIIDKANLDIGDEDKRAIKELEDQHAATKSNLEELAHRYSMPEEHACAQCRVPLDALRLRQ